jgi:hypothetical protein
MARSGAKPKRKPTPTAAKDIKPLILYLFGTAATFLLSLALFLLLRGLNYDSLYWAFIWGFVIPWTCCVAWLWLKIKRNIATYIFGYLGLIVYFTLMTIFRIFAGFLGYHCEFSADIDGEY